MTKVVSLRSKSNQEALDVILWAIDQAGYKAGEQIWIALDAASTESGSETGKYSIDGNELSGDEMVDFLAA